MINFNVNDYLSNPSYNLKDIYVHKEGTLFSVNQVKDLFNGISGLRISTTSRGFEVSSQIAVSEVFLNNIRGYMYFVVVTSNPNICRFPADKFTQVNRLTSLIKWDIRNNLCFTILPNPEYNPSEVAQYLVQHHKNIATYCDRLL